MKVSETQQANNTQQGVTSMNAKKTPINAVNLALLKSIAAVLSVGVINGIFFSSLYSRSLGLVMGMFALIFVVKLLISIALNKRWCNELSAALLTLLIVLVVESTLSFSIQDNVTQTVTQQEEAAIIKQEIAKHETAIDAAVLAHNRLLVELKANKAIVSHSCPNPSDVKSKRAKQEIAANTRKEWREINAVLATLQPINANEAISMLDVPLSRLNCSQSYMSGQINLLNGHRQTVVTAKAAIEKAQEKQIHAQATANLVQPKKLDSIVLFWKENLGALFFVLIASLFIEWVFERPTKMAQLVNAQLDAYFPRDELIQCLLRTNLQFQNVAANGKRRKDQKRAQKFFKKNWFLKLNNEKHHDIIEALQMPGFKLASEFEPYNALDRKMLFNAGYMADDGIFETHTILVFRDAWYKRLLHLRTYNFLSSYLNFRDQRTHLIEDLLFETEKELEKEVIKAKPKTQDKLEHKPNWLIWGSVIVVGGIVITKLIARFLLF